MQDKQGCISGGSNKPISLKNRSKSSMPYLRSLLENIYNFNKTIDMCTRSKKGFSPALYYKATIRYNQR